MVNKKLTDSDNDMQNVDSDNTSFSQSQGNSFVNKQKQRRQKSRNTGRNFRSGDNSVQSNVNTSVSVVSDKNTFTTTTVNYGFKQISEIDSGIAYLEDTRANVSRSFDLVLTVFVENFDLINKQALSFAYSVANLGYIDHEKTLKVSNYEQVIQTYRELFIYSKYKGVFNGFNSGNFSIDAVLGLCFEGDAKCAKYISSKRGSFLDSDFLISYRFTSFSKEDWIFLATSIIKNYPFLSEGFGELNSSRFLNEPFYIYRLERTLERLRDGYYTTEHVIRTVDGTTGIEKPVDYSLGKLRICKMQELSQNNFISITSIPLFNSFMSSDNKKFFFIPPLNGKGVRANCSLFIPKALLITLDGNVDNDTAYINNIYSSMNVNSDLDSVTVKDEVLSITGIRPGWIISGNNNNFGVIETPKNKRLPNLAKFKEFLRSKDYNIKDLIKIYGENPNLLDDLDVDKLLDSEFWNALLGKLQPKK